MEPELFGAPEEPDRIEVLIRCCSEVLPTVVIARLLNVSPLVLTRRRERMGLSIGLRDSKLITGRFLKKLPDLTQLPLTLAEMREVRLMRHAWIVKRKGNWARLEHESEVVSRCSRDLPLGVIAKVLKREEARIAEYQNELELRLPLSEQRRLAHAFGCFERCPTPKCLSANERRRLQELWKDARRKKLDARQRRMQKSLTHAAAMKERLLLRRTELRQFQPPIPESICSGDCKESWPRLKEFFILNFRSPDGLGERCLHCTFLTRLDAKSAPDAVRSHRKKGRVLSSDEHARLLGIVAAYWDLIPGILLRKLFQIGPGTLERLCFEAHLERTPRESRQVYWTWYFLDPLPALELLSDREVGELFLLTKKWRAIVKLKYERDPEHVKFLAEERLRILQEAWKAGRERPAERHCNHCNSEYPATRMFFKPDRKYLSYVCHVCANYHQAQIKLVKRKRKYG